MFYISAAQYSNRWSQVATEHLKCDQSKGLNFSDLILFTFNFYICTWLVATVLDRAVLENESTRQPSKPFFYLTKGEATQRSCRVTTPMHVAEPWRETEELREMKYEMVHDSR